MPIATKQVKSAKRILKVVVKRMYDTDADTSYLGEYSNSRESEYSIDRAHVLDCPVNTGQDNAEWQEQDGETCDCVGDDWNRREYRYFNPSSNYEGDTPENIRKYVLQDYSRMEGLNHDQWCYLGIRAEVQVQASHGAVIQNFSSGGLWGIESDSDKSYFAEIEQEQLGELREELLSYGFSRRAIAKAFKDVEHVDE